MAAALLTAVDAQASVLEKSMRVAGVDVQYKVVLADDYDAAKAYSAILVLGGGPQTMDTIERTLDRNFRAEAERRGYIVVAPAAPNGNLFFERGARIFPEFLQAVLRDYQIVDGKFHAAGPSNGGIAAFHVAALNPDYFLSVTAFPGYMWQPTTEKLLAISKMCVYLYVGENDEYRWHDEMQREAEFLSSRHSYEIQRRERATAQDRDARGRECRAALRRLRGDEGRLQPLTPPYVCAPARLASDLQIQSAPSSSSIASNGGARTFM